MLDGHIIRLYKRKTSSFQIIRTPNKIERKYLTFNFKIPAYPFYYSIITMKNMQQKIPQETPDWTEEQIRLAELAEELRDEGQLDN